MIADLRGKGGRVRTVAVPLWVKQGTNAWLAAAAGVERRQAEREESERLGCLVGCRAASQRDRHRAPQAHDLRRACAKLCRKAGGDLEQIRLLLGHSSIQTTERYLGSGQEIAVAVNDDLAFKVQELANINGSACDSST